MAEEITTSRRDAIKFGLAALAGLGVSALAPPAAYATTGAMQFGASNDAGSSTTNLTSTSVRTLYASNTGTSGNAIVADVTASGNNSAALQAVTSGDQGSAVLARSVSQYANARGIKAEMNHASASGWAIEAESAGTGSTGGALWTQVPLAGAGRALRASMFGTGPCAEIVTSNAANDAPAITVHTNGTGLAIDAYTQGNGTVIKAENFTAGNPSTVIKAKTAGDGNVIEATAMGEGAAVYAKASGQDSNAVYALLDNASGYEAAVYARTSGSGDGVEAWSVGSGSGCGVRAIAGPTAAYGVHAEGGKAQLYLKPSPTAGAPTTGAHLLGEIFVDAAGKLYSCTTAGTPGTWTPVINTTTSSAVPKVISDTNADYILMVEQKGTGYALEAKGAKGLHVQGSVQADGATQLNGTVSMSRSGRAKIAKGKKSVTITVPGGVATTANVICTMQGSGATIRYAKRYSATKIKIYLTKAATSTCYAAWMVLG